MKNGKQWKRTAIHFEMEKNVCLSFKKLRKLTNAEQAKQLNNKKSFTKINYRSQEKLTKQNTFAVYIFVSRTTKHGTINSYI